MTQKVVEKIRDNRDHADKLGESAREIGEISQFLSQMAGQTQILSVNALISSANAGEAGQKFAAVANEIKSLALESGISTKKIMHWLEIVQQRIKTVVDQTVSISEMLISLNSENSENGEAILRESAGLNSLNEKILSITSDSEIVSDVLSRTMSEANQIEKQIQSTYKGIRELYAVDTEPLVATKALAN